MYKKKNNNKCLDCGIKIIQSRNGKIKHCLPFIKCLRYKNNAKERKIEFNLTSEEFQELWQKPCYYCGSELKDIGIDRVNNELGYTFSNVVPCCKLCNFMKGKLSKENFINRCKSIANKF